MDPESFNDKCMHYIASLGYQAMKPKRYQIPPEVIEFINAVGDRIIKQFAFHIDVCLYDIFIHQAISRKIPGLPPLDSMDWVCFVKGGESFTLDVYLNCNPDSEHYGNIVYMESKIIYPSVCEFIADVHLWMQSVTDESQESWESREMRAQKYLDMRYRESFGGIRGLDNSVTNRMILTDSTILPFKHETNMNIVTEINEELVDNIIMNTNRDFSTSVSFETWIVEKKTLGRVLDLLG